VDNQTNKKAAEAFASALAASLAQSLTEAVGAPVLLKTLESPDLTAREGRPVHFRLTADGGLRGQCFVELYEPQVADLGCNILGRRVVPFESEHADALEKAISSAMAGLAESLSAEHGDVTLKVSRVADLAFGGMLVVPLAATVGEDAAIPMLLYFDAEFLSALTSEPASEEAHSPERIAIEPGNLKLVMDVELAMSLRFGQRQLPLREVLELTSGSVIELDRMVDDPVELLLDGKVIARGEAVIVDGNYGLRVTEVPQPIASHLGR
jgi:flagellar motor switch protein FliN/FliY